jgi:hypothetical protein
LKKDHKRALNVFLAVFCILLLLLPVVMAAEEEEEDDGGSSASSQKIGLSDVLKPKDSMKELDDSALNSAADKGTNWVGVVIIGATLAYFVKMLFMAYSGDPKKRSDGIFGLIFGLVIVVLFLAVTSTALDAFSWDYSVNGTGGI